MALWAQATLASAPFGLFRASVTIVAVLRGEIGNTSGFEDTLSVCFGGVEDFESAGYWCVQWHSRSLRAVSTL